MTKDSTRQSRMVRARRLVWWSSTVRSRLQSLLEFLARLINQVLADLQYNFRWVIDYPRFARGPLVNARQGVIEPDTERSGRIALDNGEWHLRQFPAVSEKLPFEFDCRLGGNCRRSCQRESVLFYKLKLNTKLTELDHGKLRIPQLASLHYGCRHLAPHSVRIEHPGRNPPKLLGIFRGVFWIAEVGKLHQSKL